MTGMIRTVQVLGVKRLFTLFKAHRQGWLGIISGYYTTRTMQTLFNLGFFDEITLRGSVNIDTFAESHDLDVNILRAMCDSLYCLRILEQDRSGYTLSSKGRLLVHAARGWFEGTYGYEEVFHSLEDLVRKNKVYGKDLYRRPDFVAKGSGEAESLIYFPLAIDMIARNGFKRVLDLGCGDGTFLEHLCRHDESVTGYGIDISAEAIANGKDKMRQASLDERIHLFAEDITRIENVPDMLKDMDVATVFFVFHEILHAGPEAVVELLSSFKRLFPDVPLIVFEVIRPSLEQMRKRPGMSVQYLLQHDITNQKLVNRDKWRDLFETAGYRTIEENYLRFAKTAIFTIR